MAQADYIISNQTFPNTRADINSHLQAIATNNSGTSAPTTQYAGQFWIDTTSSTWTLYIHDGSDDIQFATIDTSANTVNFIDSELGDNSVTTSKIADANVTSAKLSYPLTTFSSTGIDDNATSTAITINSLEQVALHGSQIQSNNNTGSITYSGGNNSNAGANLTLFGGSHASTPNVARFRSSATEVMRIDSSGNVGIGTSSPNSFAKLHIVDGAGTLPTMASGDILTIQNNNDISDNAGLTAISGTSGISYVQFGDSADKNVGAVYYYNSDNSMRFIANASERMRIDSSGNLLLDKTTTSNTTAGVRLGVGGVVAPSRDGDAPVVASRLSTDGTILELRKDSTFIGSIGTQGSDLVIHSNASGHCGLRFTDEPSALPTNNSGTITDNSMDLGRSSNRYDDIFATNGTIQTSDQNEKQSIQSLTTAEMNVAKRLSPLIKTFKWNSSVEEKGDSARTHTGIIAQDVQQAFTDEGLDASNYALFISSTWWEKEISVEATEEQEAHTYIDYKEEATDGYTEKTRLGVRYPELLSFIQAYNDQRFTELEARITTLETNNP